MNSSSNSRYESNYKNFVESFNEGVEFLKYDTMDRGLITENFGNAVAQNVRDCKDLWDLIMKFRSNVMRDELHKMKFRRLMEIISDINWIGNNERLYLLKYFNENGDLVMYGKINVV